MSSGGGFTGNGAGTLFGVPFGLTSIDLSFKQNVPTGGGLKGQIKLPFFDHPVSVEIGFTVEGGMTIGLDDPTGLATLHISNVLDLELDSLKFEVDEGVLTAILSGKLTPKVPGLTWPAIDLKDLKIDSKGNVKLPGGWLDLSTQHSLDFHGFKVDITKFGMGRNENGTKWIGFSGGVKLVDGLPAGASVEGLRITAKEDWSEAKISFNGVGVELDARAFYFKGHVAYRELTDGNSAAIHRFDGDIKLKLREPELEIDGALVIGAVAATSTSAAYNFFAIYVDVDIPGGIPFATTGLAFYGFAGLLAIDMEPDKKPNEAWYAIAPTNSWYNRPGLDIGVSNLKKWTNVRGSKAFGAGVTLGTFADEGYTFNGKFLLAIVFPGPIILFEGLANLLRDRAQLTSGDPNFRALAVLDERAGSMLVGIDAKYQYDSAGTLVKIAGGTEAFYKFDDPTAWHIYLGLKEPRERRIQADILSLFKANAYVMLDAHRFAMGAWVGFDHTWAFGPLSVTLQAWMENNAVVSYKPAHLYGDLWVHGAVDLKAFGFGLGLTIDARIAADVFDPFDVLGDFQVEFHLPWPLKKKHLGAHVKLRWGPRPAQPPIPAPLKSVAVEHFKTSTTWPLPMPTFLGPVYANADGFLSGSPSLDNLSRPPDTAPVVPVDCRLSINFARNVNDDAQIGLIVQPLNPEWEQIGDPARGQGPARIRYALKQVQLEKWNGSTWQVVAGKGGASQGLPELFGSWAPLPGTGGNGIGQNKFLLWSKTGFDHLRHTGTGWGGWFTGPTAYPGFPCFPIPSTARTCVDFETFDSQGLFSSPMTHPSRSDVHFSITPTDNSPLFNVRAVSPVTGIDKALGTTSPAGITINFDKPVNNLHIVLGVPTVAPVAPVAPFDPNNPGFVSLQSSSSGGSSIFPAVLVEDEDGAQFGPFPISNNAIDITVRNVRSAALVFQGPAHTLSDGTLVPGKFYPVYLVQVCADWGPSAKDAAVLASIQNHNQGISDAWKAVGNVLEPYTNYRLRIVAAAKMNGVEHVLPQLAFFQTKGPPGLTILDRPLVMSVTSEFQSGLDDLTRYVKQTVPPTVPKTGQTPLLPRPVYRGYDIGVLFNEDYVDLMYRLAGRDLSLLIYDRNNQPVRNRTGRLLVLQNPWGVADQLSLDQQEAPWLSLINNCGCVPPINPLSIPHDQTLIAADEHQILEPDTLYEGRLMPQLLHEDFAQMPVGIFAEDGGSLLGRWQVVDLVGTAAPKPHWEIQRLGSAGAYRVIQTSKIGTTDTWVGTMLVLGNHLGLPGTDSSQPPNWVDYRVSLYLKSSDDGTIGLAFRYVDDKNFYLFTMGRPTGAYRLDLHSTGGITTLIEAQVTYDLNRDYHLVVEAIGNSLRIYLDDALLFDINDASLASGGIALQCSATNGAAFSDIQVHDFAKTAQSVYRFPFTTSAFVDFFHHLQSFDDECWMANCTFSDTDLADVSAHSVANPSSAISDDEARAYERFADNTLGTSANQLATRTEITRIKRAGDVNTAAFLFRTPEPIDWTRSSFSFSLSGEAVPAPTAPAAVKLVAASLGSQQPSGENVTLLAREAIDLTGYRIEKRDITMVIGADPPITALDDPASAWIPIFEFGTESLVPPGTKVVINSGSSDSAPPSVPRVVQRFRALAGATGDVQFPGGVVDLRLVDSQGKVVHARRFLNAAAYGPLNNLNLLRKADGTAFFLLRSGFPAVEFSPGTYQMTMDFRRNNTTTDPNSVILSAAGLTTSENVVLDIPSSTL